MTVEDVLQVSGLSCEGCVDTVSERLSTLPGVSEVSVDLRPGGVSVATVHSEAELDRELVQQVLSENSGFRLV